MTDADDTTDELLDDALADHDESTEDDVLGEAELSEEDGDLDGEIFEDDESDVEQPAPGGDDDDDEDEDDPVVPLDASEDGDDELDGQPAVDLAAIEGLEVDDPLELAEQDADSETDDTIRDGEFVCRSCHMAKRASALADADELLCRDCV